LSNVAKTHQFGFGLSYTTFAYTNLSTSFLPGVPMDLLPPYAPLIQGGNPTLFDVIATVDCVVTNTGTFPVAAAEVTQLYIGIPNGLPKQLRGFSKQSMDAGKSVVMEFDLTRRDMSTWDVYQQEWVLQRGEYNVYVGASVLDIRLEGSLIIR
jgi:beta-glucosidase